MPATDLITPEVHDPLAIRRAGPEVLGLALMDARTRTLAWLSAFDGHGLPSTHAEFDAPLWLAGHVAWFQEWWIARNVQRSRGAGCDPRGPRLPSLDRRADAWFDPRTCPRAWRWSASGQDLPARREYLAATLESTLELLDKTPSSPDGLHFFRLALHREDEVCEQLLVLAQALDLPAGRYPDFWPAPPTRVLREAIWLPSQRVQLGRGGLGDSLAGDAWDLRSRTAGSKSHCPNSKSTPSWGAGRNGPSSSKTVATTGRIAGPRRAGNGCKPKAGERRAMSSSKPAV